LRRRGWLVRMCFDEDAGSVPVLEALRQYAAKHGEAFGKGAFKRFARADMWVLKGY
jgi:hypothetical protein